MATRFEAAIARRDRGALVTSVAAENTLTLNALAMLISGY